MLGVWKVEEPTWVGRKGGGSSAHQSAVRVASLARIPGYRDVDLYLSMGKTTSEQPERKQTLVRPAEEQTQAELRPQHQHSRDPEEREDPPLFILPASQNEFLGARRSLENLESPHPKLRLQTWCILAFPSLKGSTFCLHPALQPGRGFSKNSSSVLRRQKIWVLDYPGKQRPTYLRAPNPEGKRGKESGRSPATAGGGRVQLGEPGQAARADGVGARYSA